MDVGGDAWGQDCDDGDDEDAVHPVGHLDEDALPRH